MDALAFLVCICYQIDMIILLSLLVACTADSEPSDAVFYPPNERGPYTVSTDAFEFINSDGDRKFADTDFLFQNNYQKKHQIWNERQATLEHFL